MHKAFLWGASISDYFRRSDLAKLPDNLTDVALEHEQLLFLSRDGASKHQIERAMYRDVSVRFIAANLHPDHDTIATFRRKNGQAFEQVLLLASEAGLLKVGTVSVDGTKVKANASKIKSMRYDRIQVLREKLARESNWYCTTNGLTLVDR